MFQKKYQKPKQEESIPTGDQLLDTLLYKGHNENYENMQEDDLYSALQNCKELIRHIPKVFCNKHGKDFLHMTGHCHHIR